MSFSLSLSFDVAVAVICCCRRFPRRDIEPGNHLVGVYGDNWLRNASFSIMAIPLNANAKEEEASVLDVDRKLVAQRDQLKAFKVGLKHSREASRERRGGFPA